MQVKFMREEIMRAINIVNRGVTKDTVVALGGIMIQANSDNTVAITSYSANICVKYIMNAEVSSAGSFVVDAKLFDNIAKKFNGEYINLDCDDKFVVNLKSGKSKIKIQGQSAEAYPKIENVKDTSSFSLSCSQLKNILKKTIPFAAVSAAKKPILVGVLFEIENGTLHNVASDGLRVAYTQTSVNADCENNSMVICLEALKEIAKVTPDIDTKIKIRSDGRNVVFEYENYIITARILSGQYLKYKSLMNNTPTVKATVDKHKFKETLERGLLIVNTDMLLDGKKKKKTPVVLSIGNEKIQLEAETQKGTVKDDCAAECYGELRIGFNCEYLIDMISVCDSETITLEMSNAVSAVYVHDTGNTTYLVLPVRLK